MNNVNMCRTVLLVEDNEMILETFKDLLELEGYETITAKNGIEALAALEKMKHPCLILLDLFMPIMDGFQLIEHLREHDQIASLPIIICSAAGEQTLETTAKQVRGYIKKPVDLDILLNIVRKYCTCQTK